MCVWGGGGVVWGVEGGWESLDQCGFNLGLWRY